MVTRVLIMAGGTGGHIFPALAVAEQLRSQGANVRWLGTRRGLESRIVPAADIPMDVIAISGLRGKGLVIWILLPFRMAYALLQSLFVIMRYRPLVVLGMGGFVSGPGAVVTWLLRIPLLIHEQNAVAGLTNRILSHIATRTLIGFPGAFVKRRKTVLTGNPVRADIAALAPPGKRLGERNGPLRLLVLGGSQGAQAVNEAVPKAIARLPADRRPKIWHQAGERHLSGVQQQYQASALEGKVVAFIDDMADAMAWADVVVCRAGALTIAELTAAGVASILIPYPFAVDDHQTRNALFLSEAGAAILMPQSDQLTDQLATWFDELLTSQAVHPPGHTLWGTGGAGDDALAAESVYDVSAARERLLGMAQAARRLARPDAACEVARICTELAHV